MKLYQQLYKQIQLKNFIFKFYFMYNDKNILNYLNLFLSFQNIKNKPIKNNQLNHLIYFNY